MTASQVPKMSQFPLYPRARLFSAIFVLLCLLIAPTQSGASGMPNHTSAKQAIMVDYDTGMVLYAKNPDQQMPTSSMSKVMTMYMVFEALKDGRISMDDTFRVSEKAWRKGGSKMFVEVGEQVKIVDLIRGVIVQSGNDAAIVLAEGLAGSEAAFAEAMNAKARELGMSSSHFVNASGWPNPDHYSTARDMAVLTRALIKNFPEYYDYYSKRTYTYNNITQRNRNPLLYRQMGADGVKTGHTEAGGYGLIASGNRNDRRVILVVNGLKDEKARAAESARLLDWGLSGFENIALFVEGETVVEAPVILGQAGNVPLTTDRTVTITIPKIDRDDLKVWAEYEAPLEAPVSRGTKLGTLHIQVPRLDKLEKPLFIARDVEKLGLFSGLFAKLRLML